MKTTRLLVLLTLSTASNSALADDNKAPASESEQIAKIGTLPVAECQKDLKMLRYIHGQLKKLNEEQGEKFLKLIVGNMRAQGVQKPPPPAPCSEVTLALERRCGDENEARSRCR